jgi:hypothetical protein
LGAEVLEQRRKACAVRIAIGLPAGEIFVKHPSGDGSEPDVAWQCAFADAAAPPRTSRPVLQVRNLRASERECVHCTLVLSGKSLRSPLFDRRVRLPQGTFWARTP